MNYLIYAAYAAPFVVIGLLAFCVYRKVFGERPELEKATAMQTDPDGRGDSYDEDVRWEVGVSSVTGPDVRWTGKYVFARDADEARDFADAYGYYRNLRVRRASVGA